MRYAVRGAVNSIDGETCPRFSESKVNTDRFIYFQTKLFGSAPYGEELYWYKLLPSGKPSAEQRKIDIAVNTAKRVLSDMNYNPALSHILIQSGDYFDVFDVFPVVIDGRVYGLNVDVSMSIDNKIRINYDNFIVKNGLSASVAIYLLNNVTNIKNETLKRWRGVIGYANLVVDYSGNHILITYDANAVREAEGKEFLRNHFNKDYESPSLPLCVQCKLKCSKRINRIKQ